MFVVPESEIAGLVSAAQCFEAVEAVFSAMARNEACNFPVIREAIGHADALYGFKSGFDRAGKVLGLKSGGYWPGNAERGLTNHQSTVVLFDPDTGRPAALVGGNLLTALRTAAASAVSIRHLARSDSRVLGLLGAGHQSAFQMRAAVAERPFEKVVGWNYHPEMLPRLAETAAGLGLPFEAVSLEDLGAHADVIVTISSSFSAQLMDAHVRPGTHLACMGTDTKGKQEIDAAIFARARVFTDEVAQSVEIGEAQHAVAAGLIGAGDIVQIGEVINGTAPGRQSEDDITLFDGTGVGLQDLAVAARAVAAARAKGVAVEVDL
ncbi:ornithine cyclodeaminase [Rhodovulum sulfidophilum]|uniref:Ornithine cyclodeaminase family protein n=1 Tax=Rhodovulum visakhapatnamense TaxID=364297 RepID=A0ABS1RH35_9RHOB|nr:iminosuccinate reductase BhcD [Rhodovulum visakhapatnamense]MBL3567951.1 ornithine cyclodeaminase family protein [Rhodovulum visakhapatnamense]MBL3578992.1 ornithine cyclodeaminase family protein [Rhodovulum visakhapatnamense]OLS46315.1 ornithine cyclodeaminase [Rhodovulum sulfidophilum]